MNRVFRRAAVIVTIAMIAIAALGSVLSRARYSEQFRDAIDAPPSARFPLGTDELGRDRLARLLKAMQVSMLLAPAAALVSTVVAALAGGIPGYLGGRSERMAMSSADIFVSLPWLFLLLAVRALLPLNVTPAVSVLLTFLLLGALGWAAPARVIRTAARGIRGSDYVLQARAAGASPARVFFRHLMPNLRPVLGAQFCVSVPLFVIAEANLGLLGLGVAEPLPSLGSMLRELENSSAVFERPWILAPILVLIVSVGCLHFAAAEGEPSQ